MVCPHCLTTYVTNRAVHSLGEDSEGHWQVKWEKCPSCELIIALLTNLKKAGGGYVLHKEILIRPKAPNRKPVSKDVPANLTSDYLEACIVLQDSPKASAALSRRCLQLLLRECAKVKPQDLSKEIDEVLASGKLPSQLAGAIDAVRHIGNFAAHPMKVSNTGAIVEVEPGEAEWLLDVLEGLFDYYFVAPAELQRKRDALNAKLQAIGKPPLK